MRFLTPLLLLVFVSGCAKYEFDIVNPPDLQTHIGGKTDAITTVDPLTYKWRAVDNRLVARIYNPTSDPIELHGARSTVVSPDGQSHPLRSQTIAPNSHARVILPPPRPRVYNSGPTFGVGVGMRVDARDYGYPDPPYDTGPRYLMVLDDENAFYWDWQGETEVRLTLVYQRGEQSFSHEFTIRRKKM